MKIERIKGDFLGSQSLRIKRGAQAKITAETIIVKYIDKSTKQYVFYIPALDISAYGETATKAQKMLEFSVEDFFKHLIHLSPKEAETELRNLGWMHDKLKNKEFSRSYVDVSGELKNFAVGNKVEQGVLTF